jgi:formate-dependent nitrite reductase cytochrome c552 subunit
MFAGTDGFGVKKMPSAHSKVMPRKCVTCHMYREKTEKDKQPESPVKKGGHTFRSDERSCLECHEDAKTLVAKWRTEISPLLEQLKSLLEGASNKESKIYEEARLNYDIVVADGGIGIHNPRYAGLLLRYSISSLTGESEPEGLKGRE